MLARDAHVVHALRVDAQHADVVQERGEMQALAMRLVEPQLAADAVRQLRDAPGVAGLQVHVRIERRDQDVGHVREEVALGIHQLCAPRRDRALLRERRERAQVRLLERSPRRCEDRDRADAFDREQNAGAIGVAARARRPPDDGAGFREGLREQVAEARFERREEPAVAGSGFELRCAALRHRHEEGRSCAGQPLRAVGGRLRDVVLMLRGSESRGRFEQRFEAPVVVAHSCDGLERHAAEQQERPPREQADRERERDEAEAPGTIGQRGQHVLVEHVGERDERNDGAEEVRDEGRPIERLREDGHLIGRRTHRVRSPRACAARAIGRIGRALKHAEFAGFQPRDDSPCQNV